MYYTQRKLKQPHTNIEMHVFRPATLLGHGMGLYSILSTVCHQYKLLVMTTVSASRVFALVEIKGNTTNTSNSGQDHRQSGKGMQQLNANGHKDMVRWIDQLLHPAPNSVREVVTLAGWQNGG